MQLDAESDADSDADDSEIVAIMNRSTSNQRSISAANTINSCYDAKSATESSRKSWLRGEIEALQNFPKLGIPLKLRSSFKTFRKRIRRHKPDDERIRTPILLSSVQHNLEQSTSINDVHNDDGSNDEHLRCTELSPIASQPMSVETSCSDLRDHFMRDIDMQTGESLGTFLFINN